MNRRIMSAIKECVSMSYFDECCGTCRWHEHDPWDAIRRFQDEVRKRRLIARHKKETDRIDAVMEPVKDAPAGFFDWIWESGMSFSRYLIYKA